MTQPAYGIVINQQDNDPRAAQPSDLSIIGLIGPSDDADAGAFPLNTCVAMDSFDTTMLAKLGTGDLYAAMTTIDAQLADLQTSARVVVVRVAKGLTIDATITNILGNAGAATGIYAFLRAGVTLGIIPRVIIAPGYLGHCDLFEQAVVVTAGGSGYTSAPTVVFTPPGAQAHAVLTGSAVSSIVVDDPGDYEPGTSVAVSFTGGGGTGATAVSTLGMLANPVAAALPAVLDQLLGIAIVDSDGTGFAQANAMRELLSSPRLIPADAWTIVTPPSGTGTMYQGGSAVAAGLFARVDFRHEGLPFWSISGQPVQGILGVKNLYSFSIVDGANQGQELLANQISIIEKGEAGVETAIAASGFVWVGVWNASSDPLQWFYNKRRGRDYTHLMLLKSIRLRLGVENVTPQGVQDVLNDMQVIGSELIRQGAVAGFKCTFEAARNSPDNLRQGKFTVGYAQEEPAPITQVTIDSRPFYEALTAELATLVAQAAQLPARFLS